MKKKIVAILLIGLVMLGLTGCVGTGGANGFGAKIKFDNLELAFDDDYSFEKVDNEYSDISGSDIIKLGVNIKNLSSEEHELNMFFYSIIGSKGELTRTAPAFFDDTVDFSGKIKAGESKKVYFYIVYDGDGTYKIEFDNFTEQISLEFDIKK